MQLTIPSLLGRSVALLSLSLCALQAANYTFTTIQYPGAAITTPYGINNLGEVVGAFQTKYGQPFHGFTYSAGVYTQYDECGSNNFLVGINDNGVIVGNCDGYSFVYKDGAFTRISQMNAIYPQGINNDSVIVGWHEILTPVESSFVLYGDKALYKSFQAPDSTNTQALGISNSNVIVGTALLDGASAQQAFTEQDSTFSFYRYPNAAPGVSTVFSGINQSGMVAGYLTSSIFFATPSMGFVFQNGTFTPLQLPFSTTSSGAFGINDSGVIVGSYNVSASSTFGYIATPQD